MVIIRPIASVIQGKYQFLRVKYEVSGDAAAVSVTVLLVGVGVVILDS